MAGSPTGQLGLKDRRSLRVRQGVVSTTRDRAGGAEETERLLTTSFLHATGVRATTCEAKRHRVTYWSCRSSGRAVGSQTRRVLHCRRLGASGEVCTSVGGLPARFSDGSVRDRCAVTGRP